MKVTMMMTSEHILWAISILAVVMLIAITLEVSGIADVVRNWWRKRKEDKDDAED